MNKPNEPNENPDFQIEQLSDGSNEGLLIRLNRPAKLNAITKPILLGLASCLDQLEAAERLDARQRILIIAGTGPKAFCAGTDLAETSIMSKAERETKTVMARDLLVRLSRSKVISVAAINGLAFGGGMELAMACTFRVAAEHASFSLPEIKLGLLPAYGGTQFLPPLVGKARALEIMLTGQVLTAKAALDMGLVNRLASAGALLDESLAMAAEVTRFSPLAIQAIRACVLAAGEEVTDAGLGVEDQAVRKVFTSEDAQEGIAAFLEKRPAKFTGR
jgi:enoyl-CoA hydratase